MNFKTGHYSVTVKSHSSLAHSSHSFLPTFSATRPCGYNDHRTFYFDKKLRKWQCHGMADLSIIRLRKEVKIWLRINFPKYHIHSTTHFVYSRECDFGHVFSQPPIQHLSKCPSEAAGDSLMQAVQSKCYEVTDFYKRHIRGNFGTVDRLSNQCFFHTWLRSFLCGQVSFYSIYLSIVLRTVTFCWCCISSSGFHGKINVG